MTRYLAAHPNLRTFLYAVAIIVGGGILDGGIVLAVGMFSHR